MRASEAEKPTQFMRISDLLRAHGCSTPSIYLEHREHDPRQNSFVIEDFGDTTYAHVLANPERAASFQSDLYTLAVDTLTHIAENIKEKPTYVETYTHENARNEAMLLCTWYGKGFAQNAVDEFEALLDELLPPFEVPMTLMLRDYHRDNLFYLPERTGIARCGLIDFQDAQWGAVGYDLVSLTHDVRVDVPKNLRHALTARYLNFFPETEHAHLRQTFHRLNLARHMRILGVFSRLSKRDGKIYYLTYIPRILRHIAEICEEAAQECDSMHKFFDDFRIFLKIQAWFTQHIAVPV